MKSLNTIPKPNLTAETYWNDKKENKGNPFLLPGYVKNDQNANKRKRRRKRKRK
jgi:hypothetical protein